MTFEFIRIVLILTEVATDDNIDDYKVVIYSTDPLTMSKAIKYGKIPDCFNCKVHAFDIDIDKKIIFIRSEVRTWQTADSACTEK